jgi:hypothetical protein
MHYPDGGPRPWFSTLASSLISTPNNTLLPWGYPDRYIIEDSLARSLYTDFKF